MLKPAYTFEATVIRWVDGDTVDLKVDLGFHMTTEDRFRLFGIDTAERGQALHAEATRRAIELAPPGTTVVAKTFKAQDKYGRYLAEIWALGISVNQQLLLDGLAKVYFGGTKA